MNGKSTIIMIETLKLYFPFVAKAATDYEEVSFDELIITLDNGERLLYDNSLHSITNLSKNPNDMNEKEFAREFGMRLNKLMIGKGVTQQELALSIGVNQGTISRYLNGKKLPSFYKIYKIAECLGCSVDELTYSK